MQMLLLPLRRTLDFSGRSAPKEALFFIVSVSVLFLAGMGLLFHGAGTPAGAEGLGRPITFHAGWLLVAAVTLGSALPMAAVLIRRLHDANRSGWYALLFLIPSLGFLILFYFVMLPGDAGVNRYGASYQRR